MLPDRTSNPEPLTYESDALPIALRGPAYIEIEGKCGWIIGGGGGGGRQRVCWPPSQIIGGPAPHPWPPLPTPMHHSPDTKP